MLEVELYRLRKRMILRKSMIRVESYICNRKGNHVRTTRRSEDLWPLQVQYTTPVQYAYKMYDTLKTLSFIRIGKNS